VSSRIHARGPRLVAPSAVSDDAAIVSAFLTDAAHVPGGFASGVAFPRTEGEVAALLSNAAAVLPVGAQSSLTGGATPRGDLVLSTRGLTEITILDSHRVRVGAGVMLSQLQQHLARQGLYYPPVPTYDGAFVGGTIATNAAGAATFKYGSTRPWVEALTVVLASGFVLDITRGQTVTSSRSFEVMTPDAAPITIAVPTYRMPEVPKLSAGYYAAAAMDLIDLIIGSEGTLGVITEAVVRVIDRPVCVAALVSCNDDGQALALTGALRDQARLAWTGRGPLDVSAIEYMDARSLRLVPDAAFDKSGIDRPRDGSALLLIQMEISQREEVTWAAFAEILDSAGVTGDPLIATAGDDRGVQRMFDVREAVPASVNARVAAAKQGDDRIEKTAGDFIVPFGALGPALAMYRRVIDDRQLDYAIWGHASDGNLHVNIVPRCFDDVVAGREALMAMARGVIEMGGSPLAEHGVGRSAMKQRLLRQLYGDVGIEEMRAVKRAFDPQSKLSRGVLFPPSEQLTR
jgi:D-lactate dehydrogenase (cytochrome)